MPANDPGPPAPRSRSGERPHDDMKRRGVGAGSAGANETLYFWAKLGFETWPNKYHPVLCHLIDVGQVAAAIWRDALRDHTRQRVAKQLGLGDDVGAAGAWVAFWVAAHDIGKITPGFQFQVGDRAEQLNRKLCARGFDVSGGHKYHDQTGTNVLFEALRTGGTNWPALDRNLVDSVAVAVGGHHGTFPTNWYDFTNQHLGNEKWAAARCVVVEQLARLFGIPAQPKPTRAAGNDQSVWMFLAGLTSVADWVGSNTDFFSAFIDEKNPLPSSFNADTYFTESGKNAGRALHELGWLPRAALTGTLPTFESATGISHPRPLQEHTIALAQSMTEPRLVIVEAPMGEGKTEAAWYLARCWDERGGGGTYVALPTMATSNQMFERVEKFLDAQDGKRHLQLLHGKSALNPNFAKLKAFAEQYGESQTSGVVAEEWFAKNKKQALLAPYGVGTIDQVLLAVLQTPHVFVRLFGLAGKCVILDEVHAYDAYMTTLMERLLQWLAALGCPVVLLSATLPADKRAALLKAYAGNVQEPERKPYPRVTSVVPGGVPEGKHVPADPTRAKTISLKWVENDKLVGTVKERVQNGGCAAVIRNTVGAAQETYTALRDALAGTGIEVELFHARFPFGRRQEIEDAVLKRFGKSGGPNERDKRVLVATQVIEQSLDLDFDVMFSDVAPVDLVLQRAGRLHRHARGNRGPLNEPTLWLIEPNKKEGPPDFGYSEWVYARFVLLKSFLALKDRRAVELPSDLEGLVEQIYGNEPTPSGNEYQQALEGSRVTLSDEQRVQRQKAKGVMIRKPDAADFFDQQSAQLLEDDPEAHKKIQAATRDAEPTIHLILVYHCDGHDYLDPGCTDRLDPSDTPSVARLRMILENEVSISHRGCVLHYAKRDVPPGWKKSGMLRYHRLLRLSDIGQALDGFVLRYRNDVGVTFAVE
ncbi:MAG: CRISPR-associated helicase Cas3' [Planctomycetes bacterium]|nr:CRISPR-associated helicase Cas3' [Planctomycetota bacterium]